MYVCMYVCMYVYVYIYVGCGKQNGNYYLGYYYLGFRIWRYHPQHGNSSGKGNGKGNEHWGYRGLRFRLDCSLGFRVKTRNPVVPRAALDHSQMAHVISPQRSEYINLGSLSGLRLQG